MKNIKKLITLFIIFIIIIGLVIFFIINTNRSINNQINDTNMNLSKTETTISNNNRVENKETENIANENHSNNVTKQEAENKKAQTNKGEIAKDMKMNIKVNGEVLTVALNNNSSAEGLIKKLEEGTVTINMKDYGSFEKVGSLGFSLPRNDENITTEPGDVILYQGNQLTIYYDTNNWSFTRLGKIENKTQSELKRILGSGDVTVTLELAK